MPYKTDKMKLDSPFLDRRVKLLPCQKEMVASLHTRGASISGIARMYGVSKRLIQFIIFPEKLAMSLKRRAERGGSKIYYDREYHNQKTKEHRHYKNQTL